MKTSRRASLLVLTAAVVAIAIAYPAPASAETEAQWSVQVGKVDPGAVTLAPSFQAALYENLMQELGKTKRFKQVLREGDYKAGGVADLLVLKTTVAKYTAGSETRRAVTTVAGATKLTVRAQLVTPDGKVILERTVNGNVRFFGSNLRATHNLARNLAKTIKKSSLPAPESATLSKSINSTSSDDIVVVEFR